MKSADTDKPLVNRVKRSGIITLNLEDYYPTAKLVDWDLAPYLFQGLLLREKEFRVAMKDHDWSQYQDKQLCVFCSTDAIIPTWAYMLIATYTQGICAGLYVGTQHEFLKAHYYRTLSQLDVAQFADRIVVIKGCSQKPVPDTAYVEVTQQLLPVVRSLMYGEPCSTVPLYKRKRTS